jgi:hypothetical protein
MFMVRRILLLRAAAAAELALTALAAALAVFYQTQLQ